MMNKKQKKMLYRIIATVVLVVADIVLCHYLQPNSYVELAMYAVPYLLIGYDILEKAAFGIVKGQVFDENFLMAVATIGAIALGDYKEGVAVMLFYQIGELFQSVAVGKSRNSISALMDIRPDYANIMVDGRLEQVDPYDVEVGSLLVVNPGEKVPIDCVIVEGSTSLDTSALTGESLPRDVAVGDQIISGCINLTGQITVQTTKEFDESTVSKILDLVENSSMKKSRSENFITRFARYYTPAVCFGALALAVLPPVVHILTGSDPLWTQWINRALTFLVISCPCALVISIPLSFFAGIGCASSNGILVKGANYLEALADTRYIVFDKTGTLTNGRLQVSSVTPANGYSTEDLVRYAAYAENASSHPISVSLRQYYGEDIDTTLVDGVQEIAGHGVSALVDSHRVLAGNTKLMIANDIAMSDSDSSGTVVHIAVDGVYAGCITVADTLKATSVDAIAGLKASGVRRTVMLTGDADSSASVVAQQVGVDEYHSELLPGDKVEQVERLLSSKGEKEKLAFVGDGINDAPVLSRADVGIAMGALGSDAAIEAADIVLMDDDPAKISLAKRISVHTLRIVRENIVFALFVKAACLILGAFGIANMWIAIFADVGVMVLAVLNATRALSIKK